jgi:hypothetical protein
VITEIGQAQPQTPLVMVIWEVILWSEPPLRQRAIPLSRGRLDRIRQIQARNDLPTLPAAVSRHARPPEQIRAVRHVPDPYALDGTRSDPQRHRQETPGYSISEISFATRR